MYFSRIRIDPSSVAHTALFCLLQGDAYASHKLIWELFRDGPTTKRAFLFRQEFEKEQLPSDGVWRGLPVFYVVSEERPTSADGLMTVETKAYDPRLRVSMHLGFDLRVNPVVARAVHGKKNSAKHDVMMDAKKKAKEQGVHTAAAINVAMNQAVIDWLSARASTRGFQLSDPSLIEVSGYRQHCLRKRRAPGITFSSVDLAGSLEVTDPDLFRTLLFAGVGGCRSFGCGLMMVRPI